MSEQRREEEARAAYERHIHRGPAFAHIAENEFRAGYSRGVEVEREKHRMLPNWMLEKEIAALKQERDELRTHLGLVQEGGTMEYRQIVTKLEAVEKERDELREGLKSARLVARDAYTCWDADMDTKVGKLLAALCGHLPGYRQDTDAIAALLASREEKK